MLEDKGSRFAGAAPRTSLVWASMLAQHDRIIPPYPSPSVVEVATLPGPPLINPNDSDTRKVWRVMQAYTTAIRHLYGASFVFSRLTEEDVQRSKHFKAVLAAVPHLEALRLPPLAWVAFSAYAWRAYVVHGGKGRSWDSAPSQTKGPRASTPPSAVWTFSVQRITSRTDWFSWLESHWRGGRMVVSDAHRALMRRYARLRAALVTLSLEREVTEQDVRECVQRHLSAATYARLKDEAETAAELQQAEWTRAMKRGEWIW